MADSGTHAPDATRLKGDITILSMRVLATILLIAPLAALPATGDQPAICAEWRECRQLALDAAAGQEYETFHDLAWRAVQTGPRHDADLLYLLARAQSLSGRPADAGVMLRRLAEMGAAPVAALDADEFRRVRALPDWPDTDARIRAATENGRVLAFEPIPVLPDRADAPSLPDVDPAPAEPAAATSLPSTAAPIPVPTATGRPPLEGLRLPGIGTSPAAMAYDAVSRRFVLADDRTETLQVIDELAGNLVNLVRQHWAGLYRTSALAIDTRRGDLWVVGSHHDDPDGPARSAVHRLQLVSGRLLTTIELPSDAGAARLTGVAVAPGSRVFVLDAEGRRIFRITADGRSLAQQSRVDAGAPRSLATASDTILYVGHADGLLRLDLATGSSSSVEQRPDITLRDLRWIGWHKGTLLAIQQLDDGSRAAVRLRLDARGRRATAREVLGTARADAASIGGDVFYYVGDAPDGSSTEVRRVPLG